MMWPLCVLACGVRQVSNNTKTIDQPAEDAPDRGNAEYFLQVTAELT